MDPRGPEAEEVPMSGLDVLIRGGKIVDGTGNPWFYGDVALHSDRVVEIAPAGRIPPERARDVVQAESMVVCPGFIDIQSHSIVPLMIDGRCLSKIMQGVTTEIMGEASTPAPVGGKIDDPLADNVLTKRIPQWQERARHWSRFRDWLEAMIAHGVSPNVGSFLGGGTVREYAKGLEMGPPSDDELATMREVTRKAMEDGAFGVSYALIYPPDAYASTDEIVEVCRIVGEHSGLYITHMRSEEDQLLEALEEALEIGRRANVPVEIYHLKASGRRNWHKMPAVIARINAARAEGLDVTADMYPYTASGTGLTVLLPPWAAAGSGYFENLRDPDMRARIRAEMLNPTTDWETVIDGPTTVMPIGFQKPENQAYVGKRLNEIAAMRGQEWVDAVIDLLLSERQRISTIFFSMTEENLELQFTQPWIKISTDAGGYDPAWAVELGPYHPRAYGTYPRVLGRYVREKGILTLEDAIHKMSGAVATRLGLYERGLLRQGCYADVVILDPQTIGDRATFEQPHQLSVGVRDVWVNGERVLKDGAHTGATPGRIVAGPGSR
jgi:dihydroorotase/N-acyl-D-amino-acid deacylase